jgi:hypothetical protein
MAYRKLNQDMVERRRLDPQTATAVGTSQQPFVFARRRPPSTLLSVLQWQAWLLTAGRRADPLNRGLDLLE